MNRRALISGKLAATGILALLTLICLLLTPDPAKKGQIYLYGEGHGQPAMLDEELKQWQKYYHEDGMRHLFLELPSFGAELLNLWMRSEDDEILDGYFSDIEGTQSDTGANYRFYKAIKETCPETVFHGTDIGHFYWSMGARYLEYLRENDMEDTPQYVLTWESVKQGQHFYKSRDMRYREEKMTENFIREYDALGGIDIVGIYGDEHIHKRDNRMAEQLEKHYDGKHDIYSISLMQLMGQDGPVKQEKIRVGQKEYEAYRSGGHKTPEHMPIARTHPACRVWQLEGTGGDFADWPTSGDWADSSLLTAEPQTGDVFVVDFIAPDGTAVRKFYRCSGGTTNDGAPLAEEILPD